MRLLLVTAGILGLCAACGGGTSQHPPGAEEEADSAIPGTSSPVTPETDASEITPELDASTGPHTLDASPGPHDAAVPKGHDASVPKQPDAGQPKNGVCPSACVLEPAGVAPCTSPLRTCNCTSSSTQATGCTAVTGLSEIYCCAS